LRRNRAQDETSSKPPFQETEATKGGAEELSVETLADEAEAQVETEEEHVVEIQGLYEELEKAKVERDNAQDQLLRTMADFQNFRNRMRQESRQMRLLATEGLVGSLLPVLDNFERTIRAVDSGATLDSVVEGVRLVERQLRNALEAQGVRRIEAEGKPFDPELHEAIGTEPRADLPENTVVGEVEPGYQMGERIIRPTKVRVTRRP
jgi:molecular chaperone GrpE